MSGFDEKKLTDLGEKAKNVRRHILAMTQAAGSGHPGGSLSAVELLSVLYFHKMRHDPSNPKWEGRDYFFLSKGHAAPAWYGVLAEAGYFPAEQLRTLRRPDSILHGHPSSEHTPGVDISSGSLGQGLSVANGVALAAKLNRTGQRAYVMLGDGELQEGQVWEAAMTAAHYHLDNVCAIVDWNGLQLDDWVENVMGLGTLRQKWEAFGWYVLEINGHNLADIHDAYDEAETLKGRPTVVLAHTIKGKGVSFMENQVGWHGLAPSESQLEQALKELS
ncbi:MAG: transketolase [Actinobacteria bacterium]|nr:transketolase [Actinomycetota bacterium]